MMDTQQQTILPSESDEQQRRREQDMECLSLLQEAHALRMETAYIDRMLAALKDNNDENENENSPV